MGHCPEKGKAVLPSTIATHFLSQSSQSPRFSPHLQSLQIKTHALFPPRSPLPYSAINVAMETSSPGTLRWSPSASARWLVIGKQRLVLMGRGELHPPQAACWSMQPGHQVERVLEDLRLVFHWWSSATGGRGGGATQTWRCGGEAFASGEDAGWSVHAANAFCPPAQRQLQHTAVLGRSPHYTNEHKETSRQGDTCYKAIWVI